MLGFKFKNTEIEMSFSFFALLAVLFYAKDVTGILVALLSCLLHETGHLIFMWAFSCQPEKIVFYGGGIRIVPDCRPVSFAKERIILTAGCMINLAVAFSANAAGAYELSTINLVVGLFNLLPFRNFDGGRLLDSFSQEFPDKALLIGTVRKLLSFIIAAVCVIMLALFGYNLSLAVTLCYIAVSEALC